MKRSYTSIKYLFDCASKWDLISVRSKVDDSRSTGHGRVDFSIEEEIVAGILRDRNPHQLDGIPGGMESK